MFHWEGREIHLKKTSHLVGKDTMWVWICWWRTVLWKLGFKGKGSECDLGKPGRPPQEGAADRKSCRMTSTVEGNVYPAEGRACKQERTEQSGVSGELWRVPYAAAPGSTREQGNETGVERQWGQRGIQYDGCWLRAGFSQAWWPPYPLLFLRMRRWHLPRFSDWKNEALNRTARLAPEIIWELRTQSPVTAAGSHSRAKPQKRACLRKQPPDWVSWV